MPNKEATRDPLVRLSGPPHDPSQIRICYGSRRLLRSLDTVTPYIQRPSRGGVLHAFEVHPDRARRSSRIPECLTRTILLIFSVLLCPAFGSVYDLVCSSSDTIPRWKRDSRVAAASSTRPGSRQLFSAALAFCRAPLRHKRCFCEALRWRVCRLGTSHRYGSIDHAAPANALQTLS